MPKASPSERRRASGGSKGEGGARRVGIRLVAEESGVSTATVSRVMTGRGPVAEATRQRVLQVAQRLRYQPSAPARGLRSARSLLMGAVVPDLSNPVFVPFLRGVQHVAQEHDYAVLVVDAQRSPSIERGVLARLLAQGVDALVLAGYSRDSSRLDELRRSGVVVVEPGRVASSSGVSLASLERPGSSAMCDALAELGHRRIAYLVRRQPSGEAGGRRWAAIDRRSRALGLRADRVALGSASPRDVGEALVGRLRRADPATAFVCATHGLAPLVLSALRDARVDLPADCSLVVFGDSDWAAAYRPALSVVALDLFAVGASLTRQAIRELDGGGDTWSEPLSPSEFRPRGSTGPAPRLPADDGPPSAAV